MIRALMTAIGFFLMGKNLLGNPVDQVMMEMLSGVVLAGVSVYWGIVDKTVTIEAWQSFLRQLIVGVGGLLIAKGRISAELLNDILGAALAIIPVLYSVLSRQKSNNLAQGWINTTELKK
jgi:hypothetical protein